MVHRRKSGAEFAVLYAVSHVFVKTLYEKSHIIICKLQTLTEMRTQELYDFVVIDHSFTRLIYKSESINCVVFDAIANEILFVFFDFCFQLASLLKHEFQIDHFLAHDAVADFVNFRVAIPAVEGTIGAALALILVAET